MQCRNPKFSDDAQRIDVEIEHPVYGWIPFTAAADDSEAMGRELHAQAVAGDFGVVAPYAGKSSAALIRQSEIVARLAAIDLDSIRALRAKAAGKGKVADDAKLTALDAEADTLRVELAAL